MFRLRAGGAAEGLGMSTEVAEHKSKGLGLTELYLYLRMMTSELFRLFSDGKEASLLGSLQYISTLQQLGRE